MLSFAIRIRINLLLVMAAAALIPLAVGAGMNIYNMYQANSREKEAQQQASELAKIPISRYKDAGGRYLGFYNQAVSDVANPMGYTQPQTSRFKSRLAEILNTQKYNAENMGGGSVSRAIGAIGNANSINALNQFSANDAELYQNNRNRGFSRMASSINALQGIDNMNTQFEQNRRLMQERALGEAIRSNRDSFSNSLGNLGSDLMGFGLTKMLPTGGADTTTGTGTPRFNMPSDIQNPNIFSVGKVPRSNRFNNFIDSYATDGELTSQAPITKDKVLKLRRG